MKSLDENNDSESFCLFILLREPDKVVRIGDSSILQDLIDDLMNGKGTALIKINKIDELKGYFTDCNSNTIFEKILASLELNKISDKLDKTTKDIYSIAKEVRKTIINVAYNTFNELKNNFKG